MNLSWFFNWNREQLIGYIALIGGISLLLFTLNILLPLAKIVLLLFSLLLTLYGFMQSSIIEILREYALYSKEKKFNDEKWNKDHIIGMALSGIGFALFLYVLGVLDDLLYLFFLGIAVFFITYGFRKTHLIKILAQKTKEQELKNEQKETREKTQD